MYIVQPLDFICYKYIEFYAWYSIQIGFAIEQRNYWLPKGIYFYIVHNLCGNGMFHFTKMKSLSHEIEFQKLLRIFDDVIDTPKIYI